MSYFSIAKGFHKLSSHPPPELTLSLVYTKQKYIGTGESSDVEYASDETKFDLRGYLGDEIGDDTGQKYTRKFTIDVDGGNINDVHFKVHGTVTAWYQSRLSEAGKKKLFKTRGVPK